MRVWWIITLLTALLLLSACTGLQNNQGEGPRIVYGLTLMPSGFDPHIHASAELGIPLRSVYDTLVYKDPSTGEFVPGLAARWDMSADGLSYTFYLRNDVTFHDGTPFNAQAVGVNLDRILAAETGSQKARFMLGPISGYQIIDDHTIRLTFTEPYAPLLDSLSQVYLGIASPTQLAQYDNATYQFHQVGTGPYRMVEYVPGDRFVIVRYEDYAWGPPFYVEPARPIQTFEFRFFEDAPTRALALEGGDAQIIGEIQPIDAQLLAGNASLRLYPVPIPGQPMQFLMNTQRFPTDSVTVRRALIYATNRTAIVDAIFQRFSPVADGPLSQATQYYSPDVASLYAHDPGQAQSLLFAAGFTGIRDDGILFIPTGPAATPEPGQPTPTAETAPSGIPLQLIMIVPPWGLTPEVAQLIQSQWRELGIEVEIRQVAGFGQLQEAARSGDYNLIALNFFGSDPSLLSQFFATGASLNWTGYSDFELDTYLQEGTRQPDPDTRAQMYAAAQTRIMEQALILPIRDYVNLVGASADLQGVAFDAQGWFPLLYNFSLSPEAGTN